MKKAITILLCLTFLLLPLSACNDPEDENGGDVTVKVWVPAEDVDLTQQLADEFTVSYTAYNVTIVIEPVNETDVWQKFADNPETAADVLTFPNSRLRDFVTTGGLAEINRNTENIISRNGKGSVDASTLGGRLWAYPVSVDNSYFLYYNKAVLTDDDIVTLDGLLEAADAQGKKIGMNLYDNGWYTASFFIGAGCTLTIGADGKQVCDFNNENGLAAAGALRAFTTHNAYVDANDDMLKNGITGPIAAGISGISIAKDMKEILGEDFGAARLPMFTMGEEPVTMGSFGDFTLVGVNGAINDTGKLTVAMDFADYLTNEAAQVARFVLRAAVPVNIKATIHPAVQADAASAALALQAEYSISQNNVLGSYWSPAGAFGAAMVNGDTTELQTLLDNMVAQIQW